MRGISVSIPSLGAYGGDNEPADQWEAVGNNQFIIYLLGIAVAKSHQVR